MSGVRLAVSMILLSVFARTETATPRQLNQELQAGTGQTPAPAVVYRLVARAQLQLEQHAFGRAAYRRTRARHRQGNSDPEEPA